MKEIYGSGEKYPEENWQNYVFFFLIKLLRVENKYKQHMTKIKNNEKCVKIKMRLVVLICVIN